MYWRPGSLLEGVHELDLSGPRDTEDVGHAFGQQQFGERSLPSHECHPGFPFR